MGWYKDRVTEHLDVNQAIRDAGRKADAIGAIAGTVKTIGDTNYSRKLQKKKFADKAADRASKEKVASIKADATKTKAKATVTVAGIKYDTERYKSDSAYKKEIDSKILENRGKKIQAGAKIKSARINAGAKLGAARIGAKAKIYSADKGYAGKKYSADKGVEKQKIASETSSVNNFRTTQTSEKVARINASAKKAKAKAKATKKTAAKLDLSGSDEDILKRLRKSKKASSDIGDFDIT